MISPFLIRPLLGVGAAALMFVAFSLWLSGVKREAYDQGKEDTIHSLAEETEKLKTEHKAEADALRSALQKRDRRYAQDIADITRQALLGAAPDRVAVDGDTRRMLNARTARSNTDIEDAASGIDAALPATAAEEP